MCIRDRRCAFRDRDDEAGDIYEQQYEGRVCREKERKMCIRDRVYGVQQHAAFVRVHDVKENMRAIRMTQAIMRAV